MRTGKSIRRSRHLGLSLLVLIAILLSTVGASAAGIPQPPTVGPSGNPPAVQVGANVTTPQQFFGYNPGEDYKLTPWQTRNVAGQGQRRGLVEYAYELQRTSSRVHVIEMGKSTLGRPMIYLVITSPDNWARIDQLKAVNRKLADPRQIASDAAARALAEQGKLVYWISGNIHSTERTSAEMFPRLEYKLAAFQDDWTKTVLDNLIVIIEPSSNPDGLDMVVDWYYKYLGTPYTNSSPLCYNNYMCHDNNRDFFGLQLVESRNIANARDEWKAPQHLDIHQAQTMLYQSPSLDPPNDAIDGLARAEWLAYGSNNVTKMTALDWHGVFLYNYPDVFYPGYNESWSNMHNGLGTYWEVRGANLASPTRITSGGYGLAWYNPYPIVPPFDWHLMDAVNLEEDAVLENLDYSTWNKTPLLYNFYLKGKRNMATAIATAPYGYIIPMSAGDNADVIDMVNNLVANKIEVQRATDAFTLEGRTFAGGDFIVRLDQPYGLSAKNYLDKQAWPIPGGTPYDVTAWTYGYLRDVATVPVNVPLPAIAAVPVTGRVPYLGTMKGDASQWYLIEHETNNNLMRALPQIWAKAMPVFQANAAVTVGTQTYPAGTIFVKTSGSAADHAWLKTLVERLGLKATSLQSAVAAPALRQPRVGLYQPYSSPMNEGWLRLRLDDLKFPYTTLHNSDIATPAALLRSAYDVIILPSNSPSSIKNGSTSSSMPPEYRGGITQAGIDNLKAFVQAGGILVLNGNSSPFGIANAWGLDVVQSGPSAAVAAIAEGELPDNVKALADMMSNDSGMPDRGLWDPQATAAPAAAYDPGSILAVKVDPSNPVAYGYGSDEAIWAQNYPFFSVTPGGAAKAVAWYPEDRDALLSGYLSGGEALYGKAAIVDAPLGDGHVVMFGTDATYRGQSTGDFMFLFNAILMGGR